MVLQSEHPRQGVAAAKKRVAKVERQSVEALERLGPAEAKALLPELVAEIKAAKEQGTAQAAEDQ